MPPPEAVLFIDRNAGRKLAEALRADGYTVHHHDDLFAPDASDATWLRRCGEEGWVVITLDDRIRYRALEKQAVKDFGVKMVIPSASGNLRADELIELFRRWLPKALRHLAKNEAPVILRVRRGGSVDRVGI